MNFTLVYWDTTLKAAGSGSSRYWEKHYIRRQFSQQLEALWNLNQNLADYDSDHELRRHLSERFKRCGIGFIPLVVEMSHLVFSGLRRLYDASLPQHSADSQANWVHILSLGEGVMGKGEHRVLLVPAHLYDALR
jgi:hypothetical protein